MKKVKTLVTLMTAAAMTVSLAACGSSSSSNAASSAAASSASTEASSAASAESSSAAASSSSTAAEATGTGYTIGHTNLGTGVWILDQYQVEAQYVADSFGMTLNPASANFSADQMLKDVQNQIASGEDGHLYFGAIGTLTPTVNEMFEDAEVYYAVFNQLVAEADLPACQENPYYCGSTGSNHLEMGKYLGEQAAAAGLKTAVCMAGAVGDNSSDLRIQGFTEAFEAAGGKVIGEARCSDPSEAAAKADDILAAYGDQIDCFYGLNMDYILAAIHSAENYGLEGITFVASECDTEGLEYVKQGILISDANEGTDSIWAELLVINALDGHKIVDEDGNAPYFDILHPWLVTAETADDYEKYWLNDQPIPVEAMEQLLYRYNPDVTYQDWVDTLTNYGYDWVMSYHQ